MLAFALLAPLLAFQYAVPDYNSIPDDTLNRRQKELQQDFDAESAGLTQVGACRIYEDLHRSISGLELCSSHCGDLVQKAQNGTNSVTCIASGRGRPTKTDPQGFDYTIGGCMCNAPFVDEAVDGLIMALPAIAEIGCAILFNAFDLVLEAGAEAIPGVGEAIDAGMSAAVRGAKTIAENGQDASSFLQWFANPCGSGKYAAMINALFDPLSKVSDDVAKGSGCKKGKCPGKKGGNDNKPDKSDGDLPGTKDPAPSATVPPVTTRSLDLPSTSMPSSPPLTTVIPSSSSGISGLSSSIASHDTTVSTSQPASTLVSSFISSASSLSVGSTSITTSNPSLSSSTATSSSKDHDSSTSLASATATRTKKDKDDHHRTHTSTHRFTTTQASQSSTPSPLPSGKPSKGPSTGAKVGIAIGAFVSLLFLGGLGYLAFWLRRKSRQAMIDSDPEDDEYMIH